MTEILKKIRKDLNLYEMPTYNSGAFIGEGEHYQCYQFSESIYILVNISTGEWCFTSEPFGDNVDYETLSHDCSEEEYKESLLVWRNDKDVLIWGNVLIFTKDYRNDVVVDYADNITSAKSLIDSRFE